MFDFLNMFAGKTKHISLLVYLQYIKNKDLKEVKFQGKTYNLDIPEDVEALENAIISDLVSAVLGAIEKHEK